MAEIDGFILAGGASSRMGRDKARLLLGGQTLIERVAASLASITERVSVVSSRHDAFGCGLPVIADVHEGRGALGGLHAALAHSRADWVAIVSCDTPFVTAELFRALASRLDESSDAVAPVQPDARPQPLCALYRRRVCLQVTERLLCEGELRPRVLLQRVRTRWVPFEELAALEGAGLFFTNVNTPEDYEAACRRFDEGRTRI